MDSLKFLYLLSVLADESAMEMSRDVDSLFCFFRLQEFSVLLNTGMTLQLTWRSAISRILALASWAFSPAPETFNKVKTENGPIQCAYLYDLISNINFYIEMLLNIYSVGSAEPPTNFARYRNF
jgi:hypothetical protein